METQEKMLALMESSMMSALETYANVHRGSGVYAATSTALLEEARSVVLDFAGLSKRSFSVVFCSPLFELLMDADMREAIAVKLGPEETGIHLGVVALLLPKKSLNKVNQVFTGGGTTQLYGPDWVIWAKGHERLEAGTPAIINCIGFARGLQLIRLFHTDKFPELAEVTARLPLDEKQQNGQTLAGLALLEELRSQRIGNKLLIPSKLGATQYVHFDNASSTPALEPVWEAFRQTWALPEVQRKQLVDQSAELIHQYFNAPADSYDVLFTSNTTEAVNILSRGLFPADGTPSAQLIVSSMMEHSSNDLPWRTSAATQILRMDLDEKGFFDLHQLEKWLKEYNESKQHGRQRISLVSVSGASNITGICNDLSAISRLAHRYGAQLMVDAAQLVAHQEIRMAEDNIDFLVFSGHKMYAPFGAGVLIAAKGHLKFDQSLLSRIRNAATENAAGIVALVKAYELLKKVGFDVISNEEQQIFALLEKELQKVKRLKFLGFNAAEPDDFHKRIGSIAFGIGEVMPGTIAHRIEKLGGIGTRYGCHCAHLYVKKLLHFTPAQDKIQRFVKKLIPALILQGTLRISIGMLNTKNDVTGLVKSLLSFNPTQERPAIQQQLSGSGYKTELKKFIRQRKKLVFGSLEKP